MATSNASLQAPNLFNVNGLVAVVTGGGSGIGLMMARALALNGAHKVYIVGRREASLIAAAESVDTNNIIPLVGDVTSKEALASIVATITQEVGYINVLIANSGISGPKPSTGLFSPPTTIAEFQKAWGDASVEEYTDTFKVNTTAVWFSVVAFLGLLDEGNKKGNVSQKSQVVATGSIAAFNRLPTGGFAYGQSKAATTHLIKMLASGLVPFGIRANLIAPGLFPSDMTAAVVKGVFGKDKIPLERFGTEEEMAGTILYLTSKAGAYCSGSVMLIDGGRLAINPATF